SAFNNLDETHALFNIAPGAKYVPAWFAPVDSALAIDLGSSAASRFCDGSSFGVNKPVPMMARVHSTDFDGSINWTGGAVLPGADNVNFDGTPEGGQVFSGGANGLRGFNDWASLRLDQMSVGRKSVKFQGGDFADFGSGDFADFGSGDFLDFGSGSERQELDFESASLLARSAPYSLTACVIGRDAGCTAPSGLAFDSFHKV